MYTDHSQTRNITRSIMDISPMLAGIYVLCILGLMFAIGTAIVLINKAQVNKRKKNSLPVGGDSTEFSRTMAQRFDLEDRL